MNPFDEWPEYFWGHELLMENISGHSGQLILDMLAWRDKWDPIILEAMKKAEEYDPRYMLSQIERLTWEGHVLRRALIVSGADMDKIDTGNEAWMREKTKRMGGRRNANEVLY